MTNFNVSIRLRCSTAQPQKSDAESGKRPETLPGIGARCPAEERASVITERTRCGLLDIAPTKDFLVNRHLVGRAHLEPAVEDSSTG